MPMQRRTALSLLAAAGAMAAGLPGAARADEITVGYQLIYNPYAYAIASGKFEEATGWKINWVKFDSGAKVITAMASGWMRVRQRARMGGIELPLILSDHADWDELTRTIEDMGAPRLWVTHGREEALVHYARSKGVEAEALSLVGFEEEGS